MEKPNDSTASERIRDLTPPKSADASMVMNGAGNGMMLGGIPFLLLQLYERISKKHMPHAVGTASEFAVIVGAAVGAVYGAKEAKDLKRYREALRDEVADLRAQADARTTMKQESWADKERTRPVINPPEPSR